MTKRLFAFLTKEIIYYSSKLFVLFSILLHYFSPSDDVSTSFLVHCIASSNFPSDPDSPPRAIHMMNFINLLTADESLTIWECLPQPDQQRLACTCKALAAQYSSPWMKHLKHQSEELFLLSLINREEDAKMSAYVRDGNYQCRLITREGSDKTFQTFDTLKEALHTLAWECIPEAEVNEHFFPYLDNLLDEEEPNPKRLRLACSAAFCTQSAEQIRSLYSLKGRQFCLGCIQSDWTLALQFYTHYEVCCRDEQYFAWTVTDGDNYGDFVTNQEEEEKEKGEYNVRFYYDNEYTAWSNDFRLVGNPKALRNKFRIHNSDLVATASKQLDSGIHQGDGSEAEHRHNWDSEDGEECKNPAAKSSTASACKEATCNKESKQSGGERNRTFHSDDSDSIEVDSEDDY